jgi:hypothetical protein
METKRNLLSISIALLAMAPAGRPLAQTDPVSILSGNLCEVAGRVSAFSGTSLTTSDTIRYAGTNSSIRKTINNAAWECEFTFTPVDDCPDALDLTVRFTLVQGSAAQTSVAAEFTFDEWSLDNDVILPGAVYNGNRFNTIAMTWPGIFTDQAYYRTDLPITCNDVPRLTLTGDNSLIEEQTGDLATPAVGFQSSSSGKAFWLLTEQETRFGNIGINVREIKTGGSALSARISVTAPFVRVNKPCQGRQCPSNDRARAGAPATTSRSASVSSSSNPPNFRDCSTAFWPSARIVPGRPATIKSFRSARRMRFCAQRGTGTGTPMRVCTGIRRARGSAWDGAAGAWNRTRSFSTATPRRKHASPPT